MPALSARELFGADGTASRSVEGIWASFKTTAGDGHYGGSRPPGPPSLPDRPTPIEMPQERANRRVAAPAAIQGASAPQSI